MKRINKALNVLLASLFFLIIATRLDLGYHHTSFRHLYYEGINQDYQIIYTSLSETNEAFRDVQIKDIISEYVDQYPYDVVVESYGVSTNNSDVESINSLYIRPSEETITNDRFYKHITFDNPNRIDYSSMKANDYLTNELSDKNAFARMKPVLKYSKEVNSLFDRKKINVYPWESFVNSEFQQGKYFTMNFYVPKSQTDAFKRTLFDDFSFRFNCIDDTDFESEIVCGMMFGDSSELHVADTLTSLFNLSEIFTFPISLLFITLSASLVILLYQNLIKKREMKVRLINGNTFIQIYKDLFFPIIFNASLYFIGTFIILSFLFIDFSVSASQLFRDKLILIVGIYLLLTFVISLIFYALISLDRNRLILSKNKSTRFGLVISYFLKSLVIITILIPLSRDLKDFQFAANTVTHIRNSAIYEEGYLLSVNSNIGADYDTIVDENRLVYQYINNFNFDYVDLNYAIPDLSENERFVVMNKNFLEKQALTHANGDPIDFDSIKNDVLIGTKSKLDQFTDTYINYPVEQIEVTESFSYINIYDGTYLDSTPVIYVLETHENNLLDISNVNISTNSLDILEFTDKVNMISEIGSIIKIQDMITFYSNQYSAALQRVSLELVFFVIVLLIFVTLAITSYFEIKKKNLVVEYLNGVSKWQRYKGLAIMQILSLVIAFLCVFLLNVTLSNIVFELVDIRIVLLFCIMIVLIDLFVCLFLIQRFENKHLPSVIKGGL